MSRFDNSGYLATGSRASDTSWGDMSWGAIARQARGLRAAYLSRVLRGGAVVRLLRRAGRVLAGSVSRPVSGLWRWHLCRVAYRQLMALDDRLLADIGLRRDEIADRVWSRTQRPSATVAPTRRPAETDPVNENETRRAA